MELLMTKKVAKGGWNRSQLRTPRTERNGTIGKITTKN